MPAAGQVPPLQKKLPPQSQLVYMDHLLYVNKNNRTKNSPMATPLPHHHQIPKKNKKCKYIVEINIWYTIHQP